MKVTVCMIARDEQELLPKAIGAVKGLADEIRVGDTGSTDNTVQIAKDLGCVVIQGLDAYHKADSRNAVMQGVEGWVVILDCDEIIQEPKALRKFLQKTDADAAYIRLQFKRESQTTLEYSQMRIWRGGTYVYKYRAHEIPIPQIQKPKVVFTDFAWEHRPPPERAEWKLKYTLDRLLLDVAENPTSSRSKFYLARQYIYLREWSKALQMFEQYLEFPDHDEADAYLYMAKAYGELGQEAAQISVLHRALVHTPGRREWWGYLGEIYYARKEFYVAAAYLRAAEVLPPPKTAYVDSKWFGQYFFDLLSRSLYYAKCYKDALIYAEKASSLDPRNDRLMKNVWWCRAALGDQDAIYLVHGPDVHANQPRHKLLAEHVEGPVVIDFGCGTGDLLLLIQNKYKCIGVDTSNVALQMAKERGVTCRLVKYWPAEKANTIVCSQVLEHLEEAELRSWVKEAQRHLEVGGQLLITVPNGHKVPSPDHKTTFFEDDLRAMFETVEIIQWPDQNRIFAKVRYG